MDETRILDAVLRLGVLVFSLCLHEFGHAWAANRLGDPTAKMLGRMTINPRAHVDPIGSLLFPFLMILFPSLPLIGWAKPVPVTSENLTHPRRDMSLVALAGPSMNILIALGAVTGLWVLAHAGMAAPDPQGGWSVGRLLSTFLLTNVFLAAFNLLPIPPLDGGWLLKSVLPGPWVYKISRLEPFAIIFLVILMRIGVLNIFFLPVFFVLQTVLFALGLDEIVGYFQ